MFDLTHQLIITLPEGEQIIIPTDFTVTFNIARQNFSASANNATFNIYNLSSENRNKINKDAYNINRYIRLEFFVGYGSNITSIYKGSIVQAQTKPNGNDNVTELESQDGMFDIINTRTNVAFAAGTKIIEILNRLVADFPNIQMGASGEITEGSFKRPFVTEGNTHEAIRTITNENVNIDQEKINFLKDKEVLKGQAVVISPETGLASVTKQDTMLKIVTKVLVLNVNIGSVVDLISNRTAIYNGQYKVVGIEHSGTISRGVNSATSSIITVLDTNSRFGETKQV